mgnify:FL=1
MKFYPLADGRKLAYREAGTGRPLVLLHGWAMSSAVFQELMPLLADRFRVLAPDLPGHGQSDPDFEFNHNSIDFDTEQWLTSLDVDTVDLVGWSLGGQVALNLAKRRQLAVGKMVLVATTPLFIETDDWPNGLAPTRLKAMDRQIRSNYRLTMGDFFKLMFYPGEIDPERYRTIIRFAVREGALPEKEVARRGLSLLGNTDLRQDLPDDIPTLVHFGDCDQITVPNASRYLVENMAMAEEVCWSDCGHAPFLSRPDQSVSLWREFLL